ncbi:hypothetical protein H0X06_03280 [Candidatus Dependentiae bacterium]|nr:hypothetical protein [Candidatus Dependentiae bacterium]
MNRQGEIVDCMLTSGNVANTNAELLTNMMLCTGKVYADKGYLLKEELFKKVYSTGVPIDTRIR